MALASPVPTVPAIFSSAMLMSELSCPPSPFAAVAALVSTMSPPLAKPGTPCAPRYGATCGTSARGRQLHRSTGTRGSVVTRPTRTTDQPTGSEPLCLRRVRYRLRGVTDSGADVHIHHMRAVKRVQVVEDAALELVEGVTCAFEFPTDTGHPAERGSRAVDDAADHVEERTEHRPDAFERDLLERR
jgi:hypothetical protein